MLNFARILSLPLIEALLACENGAESAVLQRYGGRVDLGLVQAMEQYAAWLQQQGSENNARWLANFAGQLAQALGGEGTEQATEQDYLNFLMTVLQAETESNDPAVVYPILQQHLNLLDERFAQVLQAWATATFERIDPGEKEFIARHIQNLAIDISQFPLGSRANNLEIAITAYEQALIVYTQKAFPQQWATTQNNLAAAYKNRIREDRADNLERAITAYKKALEVYTQEAFPQDWAATQNNLGYAYDYRMRGDRADNLEQVIAAYKKALEVYTQEAFPEEWTMTQHNLGIAYKNRIRGDRADNLERAIAAYKKALEVRTQEAFSQDWAMTQNNLGTAYKNRIREDRADNLEQAIALYEQALIILTQEAFPQQWAGTQDNLGTAYWNRIRGDRTDNLEKAIAAHEQALIILTQEAFPQQWAGTQHNLGNAYSDRIRGDRADNLEKAVNCYRKAFIIRKPETLPEDCLKTGRNLGNLGFKEGNWLLSLEGYLPAIQAIEKSRSWAQNDDRRQEILKDAIGIYDNAIQCHINLKQYDQAILLCERARSRQLVELMASADLYDRDGIPEEIAEYLSPYRDLQSRINFLLQQNQSQQDKPNNGNCRSLSLRQLQSQTETLEDLLRQKEEIWQKLRGRDPVLAGTLEVDALDWDNLSKLLENQPHTALLSFYSTNDHTHVLIVRPNSHQQLTVHLHTCQDQGYKTLQKWIREQWLEVYSNNYDTWAKEDYLSAKLAELATRLDLNTLVANHLQDIHELILIPHIFLHLIPFAALPLGNQYLGDQFQLRILPSANILKYCQKRENDQPTAPDVATNHLGTIEAAGESLDQALAIVSLGFGVLAESLNIPSSQRLKLNEATRDQYHALTRNPDVQGLHSIHHASASIDPHLSALQLADGDLTLQELISPQWRMPQMIEVMLTCCETNLIYQPGVADDVLSLGAGFLCAGARSVISTLWQVDALATTLFCEFYYQQRQAKKSRPVALHLAQKQLRELTLPELVIKLDQYMEVAYQQNHSAHNWLSQKHSDHNSQVKKEKIAKAKDPNFQPTRPYASPQYWAAFILQGLR